MHTYSPGEFGRAIRTNGHVPRPSLTSRLVPSKSPYPARYRAYRGRYRASQEVHERSIGLYYVFSRTQYTGRKPSA